MNANHILHPYDITLFKTSKEKIKEQVDKYIIYTRSSFTTKRENIYLSCEALDEGLKIIPDNIISGFRSTGVLTPNFILIMNRMNIYQIGEITTKLQEPTV